MVAEDTTKQLEALNQTLAQAGQSFRLALAPIEQLQLLEKNARYMPHEMFRNLVENIRRDGALTSIPFCWKDGERYHVLSGNHRVKAAREAGLTHILILYGEGPITRQEFVARQLSQNAISGKDDPIILRHLWNEIDDVALKYYAGLDDKALEQMADALLPSLSDAKLDYRLVSFVFLPEEAERLQAAFERVKETTAADEVLTLRMAEFERAIDALDKSKASFNVRNAATAMMLLLDIFDRHQDELAAGWAGPQEPLHQGRVPIASIFGTDKIPTKTAFALRKIVTRLTAAGQVPKNQSIQTLQLLAEKYVALESGE